MALGQALLDLMESVDQELQLQAGEADVTRGLAALNAAQDYFESLAAQRPKILGSTSGTVTTSANTETTAFPSGVLRIDRLQYINSTTSRPSWTLDPIQEPGGHVASLRWPLSLGVMSGTGKPVGYHTNGLLIYWDPLPDGTHTVRWHGFKAADAITAGGTFAYPDLCMLPFASFAARIMKEGLGDDVAGLQNLAMGLFGPALDALARFWRHRAEKLEYTRVHTT